MIPSALLTHRNSPHFFFIQRCVPLSATQTHMEYEVYRHADAADADFVHISNFFKNIMLEDKELCNGAQKNLNGGIFLNGELHPRAEKVTVPPQTIRWVLLLTKQQGTAVLPETDERSRHGPLRGRAGDRRGDLARGAETSSLGDDSKGCGLVQ